MDERWRIFFQTFPETVTSEQLPVKLPRFDLDLDDLAGAAADWCQQYLKDRKCPCDLIVFLIKRIINNLRVQWAAEPQVFGYRPDKKDYQALWLMQRVIEELKQVCLDPGSIISLDKSVLTPVWWSSFVLKNTRRLMEDYIAVVPYLHTLFDIENYGEASFYAVYDGHNGLDAAVYSSMYLHHFLVRSTHYPTNPEEALYRAFYSTDEGFKQKTIRYSLDSGTTAVCALHRPQEKKLYVGWVGDSIATLWKNGTPLCLVNKHVPQRQDEMQRIENNGGIVSECQGTWRVDGQLAISRAIGDVKYKPHIICEPEIRALVLDGNEEFLVLCSDGLWEYTTPEEVAETIYDELLEADGDVASVGNKLALKSKAQGSKDNISVITVFLQDPNLLVARRRAVIMETAMEQRNASATLASYGQDTGDFGPETDVDTPDEPIGSAKSKVEGEANVIDESGEDSEEDGGGWNYFKKSANDTDEKKNQDSDNKLDNNSNTEDMDYKLNPDAPVFVPVSSPPLPLTNYTDRFIETDSDNFISSSPQKFKESLDNLDVPDENDFTNEIKVHAADLSKLDITHEPRDDCTALNGIELLKEEGTDHDEIIDSLVNTKNEQISHENETTFKNPFASDTNVDLNKVHDLSEYINNDAQTFNSDPYVSIMETSKAEEIVSSSVDNVFQREPNTELNNDFTVGEHEKYEQDMNSQNIDDTINTTNATVGSTIQLDDESFKYNDDLNEGLTKGTLVDKFGQFDDHKLNDSVCTTDAILGSEPNTPMRMANQSTFESENDDDQFSESFKQQLNFNRFDEQHDKENQDPFCFTEDPAGIIPNVVREENETVETRQVDESRQLEDSSNELLASNLVKHEPVEEPPCTKEVAKPFHSVYEQQDLPESDFSASTHEALLNATESEFNYSAYGNNSINTKFVDNVEIEEDIIEHTKVDNLQQEHILPSYAANDVELDDSDVDEVKDHVAGLVYNNDDTCNFEQDVSIVHNQKENDEPQYVESVTQDLDVNTFLQDNGDSNHDYHFDAVKIQNNSKEYDNSASEVTNKTEDAQQNYQSCVETEPSHEENIVETVQSNVEDFDQVLQNATQVENNRVDNSKLDNDTEIKNNFHNDFKQEFESFVETSATKNEDSQQEHHDDESTQNQMADSDEEMHSSMIIHADIENNMPQPYCSAHEALMNEPGLMSTSMTFEENFQNRNMSDSLYVMETSSDYFGEEIQQNTQFDDLVDEPKVETQDLNAENVPVEPSVENNNDIVTEAKSSLVTESNVEVNAESSQLVSENSVNRVDEQEENNKVSDIVIAAAAGTAAIAAVTGVALASKKSAPKKTETTVSKAKTTSTKTTATKPLASKTTIVNTKKPSLSTVSKPSSKPTTAPSTTKPTSNVRPTTVPKTASSLKITSVTKAAPKPAPKTTVISSRPTSSKATPTSPRVVSSTKTTTMSLSKTSPVASKTATATKSPTATKTNSTLRTSLVSKQSPTSGSSKPLSRPTSAPAKKLLSSAATNGTAKLTNGTAKLSNGTTNIHGKLTNGTAKLTNGDVSKISTTTKPPVSLATRMSLAPPKLPPKAKVAPKTVTPPAMPGPIRRPKAPTPKKTETATS